MTLALAQARPAQRDTLVEGDLSTVFGGLADDHPGRVVAQQAFTQDRGRMDVDPRQEAGHRRDDAGHKLEIVPPQPVTEAVAPDGVEARVTQCHLCRGPRCGIAFLCGPPPRGEIDLPTTVSDAQTLPAPGGLGGVPDASTVPFEPVGAQALSPSGHAGSPPSTSPWIATQRAPARELEYYFLNPTLQASSLTEHLAFDVEAIRRDFPILNERVHDHQLVWLDNAATTQKPQSVIDRLAHYYEHENSNIHRGAHELAARATDAFEDADPDFFVFSGHKIFAPTGIGALYAKPEVLEAMPP